MFFDRNDDYIKLNKHYMKMKESMLLMAQERKAAKMRARIKYEKKVVARFEQLREVYGSTDASIRLANELYVSLPTVYNIRRRVEEYKKMEQDGNRIECIR